MSCAKHGRHLAGCENCKERARRAWRKRQQPDWLAKVPIEEVRPHLFKLKRRGMTRTDIANACSVFVHPVSVGRMMRRDKSKAHKYVNGETAAALLAIPVPKRPIVRHRVAKMAPALASARRLQALARVGYSLLRMADETGLHRRTVFELRSGAREWTDAATEATIKAVYDRLPTAAGKVVKPDGRTITWAVKYRWALPAAWDDDTIGDPNAEPQIDAPRPRRGDVSEGGVDAALLGLLGVDELETIAERITVVTDLLRRGWSHARIGDHLRWGDTPARRQANVCRFVNEHGLEAVQAAVPDRVRLAALEDENQIRRYVTAA